jgi:trehalose 2-sulfotransferase
LTFVSQVPVALPATSYLVCASRRSGTTMLCRALMDSEIAGRPEEYFLAEDPKKLPDWRFWEEGPFGLTSGAVDRESYLDAVYRMGSTSNGVFGAKLMWNNVPWALAKFQEMPRFSSLERAQVFHTAFPDHHVIHVTRRDRVRQAVSWARMAQDGVWVVSDDEPAPPPRPVEYRYDLINGLERLIIEGERGWRELFSELGVSPLELIYEDLVTDDGYEHAIRAVIGHLQIEAPDVVVPNRRTHRQADELTEEWVVRYEADRALRS